MKKQKSKKQMETGKEVKHKKVGRPKKKVK